MLLRYLGRYINRVALAPQRILAYDKAASTVTIGWTANDAARSDRVMTLSVTDFIQRFAQHILPHRFVRIRFRGLWATAHRATKLDLVRQELQKQFPEQTAAAPVPGPEPATASAGDPRQCQICGMGTYRRLPGGNRPNRSERHRRLRTMDARPAAAPPTGDSQTACAADAPFLTG